MPAVTPSPRTRPPRPCSGCRRRRPGSARSTELLPLRLRGRRDHPRRRRGAAMTDAGVEALVDRVEELLRRQIGLRPDSTLRGRLRRSLRDEAAAHGPDTRSSSWTTVSRPSRGRCRGCWTGSPSRRPGFFRHPEHFRVLAETVLPALTAAGDALERRQLERPGGLLAGDGAGRTRHRGIGRRHRPVHRGGAAARRPAGTADREMAGLTPGARRSALHRRRRRLAGRSRAAAAGLGAPAQPGRSHPGPRPRQSGRVLPQRPHLLLARARRDLRRPDGRRDAGRGCLPRRRRGDVADSVAATRRSAAGDTFWYRLAATPAAIPPTTAPAPRAASGPATAGPASPAPTVVAAVKAVGPGRRTVATAPGTAEIRSG